MRKFAVLFMAIGAGLAANASYLYWQVVSGDYSNITEPELVTSVNVWAVNASGKTFVDGYTAAEGTVNMSQAQSIDVSAFSDGTYSFYIELANYSDGGKQNLGNSSEYATYTSLTEGHYILDTPLSVTMATPWHGGAMAAPEPTSGFLMMVGLALLGLKRRKV